MNRLKQLKFSSTVLADYCYLGQGVPVIVFSTVIVLGHAHLQARFGGQFDVGMAAVLRATIGVMNGPRPLG